MIPAGPNGEARLGFLNFVAGQGYVFWVAESGRKRTQNFRLVSRAQPLFPRYRSGGADWYV